MTKTRAMLRVLMCISVLNTIVLAELLTPSDPRFVSSVATLSGASEASTSSPDLPLFVEFFAPWCGHCKKLQPVWEAAAVELASLAQFAQVDATEELALAEQYGVSGFPTLILFTSNGVVDYSGGRSVAAFRSFLEEDHTSEARPFPVAVPEVDPDAPSQVVDLTDESFERLTQASTGATTGDWFVEVYASWCGHCKRLTPVWERLAVLLEDTSVIVARVEGPENPLVQQRFGVQAYPTLLFFRHGTLYKYQGGRDLQELLAFAKGGYAEVEGVPVPTPPSLFDDVTSSLSDFVGDFAALAKYKSNVLVVTFVVGFGTGLLILGIIWSLVSNAETQAAAAGVADADAELEAEAEAEDGDRDEVGGEGKKDK